MAALRIKTSRPPFVGLFLAILGLLTVAELVLGVVVYRRLRADLESDLGHRLVHVSQLMTTGIDAALVRQFREGDESLAAYEITRGRLARQAEAAGVENAFVVDLELKTLLDSRPRTAIGSTRYGLLAHRAEVAAARAGQASATRLYRHEDGRWRLSALAPLRGRGEEVVALAGVDATPEFFVALGALRRQMVLLGAVTLALAAVGTLLFLRQTGGRLARLRQAMSRAASGDFAARAEVPGRDAIGALGRDLDGLLASIVARRDYYEDVLGSLEVALITADAAGEVRGANASAQRLLGAQGEALVGRSLRDVLARESSLASFVEGAVAGSAPSHSAEIGLRGGLAAGGLVVAASASHLRRGPDGSGLILSMMDVTAMRAFERSARANERLAALGGMAGGLLHELRNPLASLMLYLDLLRPLELSAEASDILARAIGEGERLAAFLEDFQVFAALRPLRLEALDAGEVVAEAMAAVEWPAQARCQWGARETLGTRADRRLLEHAVRNLLQNAIEALRPGGGTVTVSVTRGEREVMVTVQDDGVGISADLLERVLDPLFTTKAQGIGMGLSIVQRVVEAHGGRVVVASERGHGATFTLRLPTVEQP